MAEINNKLSCGWVSHNGSWISYKTRSYSERLTFYQELAEELCKFLDDNSITYDKESLSVAHAQNSSYRKYCVTVFVNGSDGRLPFENSCVD